MRDDREEVDTNRAASLDHADGASDHCDANTRPGGGVNAAGELTGQGALFVLDRREVVAGLVAATAVVHAAAAQDAAPDIRIVRNPKQHNEFGIAIDYAPPDGDSPIGIVLYARLFNGTAWPQGLTAGKTAYSNLDGFSFEDVTFSDREKYRLALAIAKQGSRYLVSANFSRKAPGGVSSKAEPVDFAKFFRGQAELKFPLGLAEAEMFRWNLFGERMEVKGNDGAQLSLKFIVPPRRATNTSWYEPQLSLTLTAAGRSKFWALEGSVKFTQLEIQQGESNFADGANIQREQQRKKMKAGGGAFNSRAWIGYTDSAKGLEWEGEKSRIAATSVQRFGPKRYELGNTAPGRRKPAVEVVRDATPTRLTLRQWGKARSTLVVLRSPLVITLLGAEKKPGDAETAPPAIFHLSDAILTRQDIAPTTGTEVKGQAPEEAIEATLVGRLDEKPFSVETCYGSFVIGGDPPPSTSGESPLGLQLNAAVDFPLLPAKGLTVLHALANKEGLQSFDARGLLRHLSIVLPNTRARDHEERPIVEEEANVWSRLDFNGTEIAFILDVVGDGARPWPSARGVVTLGGPPRGLAHLNASPKVPKDTPDAPAALPTPAQRAATTATPAQRPSSAAAQAQRPPATGTLAAPPMEFFGPPPVAITLDGAHLRARRDSDNFALSFEFSGMVLELGKQRARIVPNRRQTGSGAGQSAWVERPRGFDDRALLIVHFPPQHVAERAYYRQTNDRITLPDVPGSMNGDPVFAREITEWRALPYGGENELSAKLKRREEIVERQKLVFKKLSDDDRKKSSLPELWDLTTSDGKPDKWQDKVGDAKADLVRRWNTLPSDQRAFYLGISSQAMDPDVRKVWLDVWRAYRTNNPREAAADGDVQFVEQLQRLPDPSIDKSVVDDIKRRLPADDPAKLQAALIEEKRKRSQEFISFSKTYEDEKERPGKLPIPYPGQDAIRDVWQREDADGKRKIKAFVEKVAQTYEANLENFLPVTPARLSGPSRLVFRFDQGGGTFDDSDSGKRSTQDEEQESTRAIDFSFEGLTDWGRFDLAVTRRAETLEMRPGGRIPHPTLRAIDLEPARILAYQGIKPGQSIDKRLEDIRASVVAPAETETAIELPFRLVLSPDQFGRFHNRRPVPQDVLRDGAKAQSGDCAPLATMLWSANLEIAGRSPVVRAVWSDDFRPGVFGGNQDAPARGPQAPWMVPVWGEKDAPAFRTALDAYDRHELVALSSVYGLPVMGRRNELDNLVDSSQFEPPKDYKLRNLKLFPSATSGTNVDLSGIYNPSPLGNLRELRLTSLGGSLQHDSTFTPPASALRDGGVPSNLFSAFSIERWRQITVLGRDIEVEVVYKGFLFPLGLRATLVKVTERLFLRNPQNHGYITAFLTQRKFIRIGNPKKSFPAIGQADSSRRFPVAELNMLTRETPDIVDPDVMADVQLTPFSDDQWIPDPADPKGLQDLKFGVRPNGKIDFSRNQPLTFKPNEASPLPGLCFWPRTKPGSSGNIAFECQIEGQPSPLRMPLVFVDNVAANDPRVMAALTHYYNWDKADPTTAINKPLRTVAMGGASRRYADEKQDGECHFETFSWEIRAEGRKNQTGQNLGTWPFNNDFVFEPLLQGSDQPPFYPYVHLANVRIGQAERFIGRSLPPQDVEFTKEYTEAGFPGAARRKDSDTIIRAKANDLETYVQIAGDGKLPLNMADAGDRSGGVGRPALDLKYLSRRYGLISTNLPAKPPEAQAQPAAPAAADAAPDVLPEPEPPRFNLRSFFTGDAKILGVVSFSELLALAAGGSPVPEVKEKVESATSDTAAYLQQTVLPDVERALKSLEDMWQSAQRALTSQANATAGIATLDIDEIYPDIAPALHDLIAKVERAKKLSGLDLIGAMSELQASGRRFVTAVSRTLADPITPLRQELSGKFRLISQAIDAFGKALGGEAQKAAQTLADEIKARVKQGLIDHIDEFKPFTRLLLAFPVPDEPIQLSLPAGSPSAKDVADRLDGALSTGSKVFLEKVFTDGVSSDNLRKAVRAGLESASGALNSSGLAPDAKAVVDAYKAEADDLVEAIDAAAADEIDELTERATGLLYPVVFGKDGIADQVMRANDLLTQIQERRDALESLTPRIVASLKQIAQTLARQQIQTLCAELGEKVAGVVNAILPPVSGVAGGLNALLGALDGLTSHLAGTYPDYRAADSAASRYTKLRTYLTATIITDACSADDLKAETANIAAKIVPELLALREELCDLVLTVAQEYASKLDAADAAAQAIAAQRINALIDQLIAFVADGTGDVRKGLAALRAALVDPPKGPPVNDFVIDQFQQMRTSIDEIDVALGTIKAMFEAARGTGQVPARDSIHRLIAVLSNAKSQQAAAIAADIAKSRAELKRQFAAQSQLIEDGVVEASKQLDRKVRALLTQALAAEQRAKTALVGAARELTAPIFMALYKRLYKPLYDLRNQLKVELDKAKTGSGALTKLLRALLSSLKGPSGGPLEDLFSVPDPVTNKDRLSQDVEMLNKLGGADAVAPTDYIEGVAGFVRGWETRTASPLVLLRNLQQVFTAVLRGDLAQFVDLHQIQREVDAAIRKMVPARISRSFDLKLKMGNFNDLLLFTGGNSKFGLPKPHPKGLPETLVLRANGVVDLLRPQASTYDVEGYLPGFALSILPSFDVATFIFPPTTFTGGPGKPFGISLKVERVELGEKVEFLKQIESILPAPKSGKGFYLRPLTGRGSIGIVAGYAFPVSPITIGNMFIDNLSLNVAAELPFDTGDARFIMSVSRPEAPFMISVAPYAGAGHFGLIANPKGIIGFEASFQFGGGGGFSFGPLTGKGRISVGIFVRKISGLTELYGIFYVGGSARIACFAVGAQLYVRMSHEGGVVSGEAIFTFSFSIGIKDIEYSVAVHKEEKGGSGGSGSGSQHGFNYDPRSKTIDLAATDFSEILAAEPVVYPLLINKTQCMAEHFGTYRTYFSRPSVLPVGRASSATASNSSVWVMP